MKLHLMTATALLSLAGAAEAQTASTPPTPQSSAPAGNLTRDLNSGPPVPAVYIAPAPAPVVASATPPARPATAAPMTAAPTASAPIVRPATTSAPTLPSSGPTLPPSNVAPASEPQPLTTGAPVIPPTPLASVLATGPAPASAPIPPPGVSTITELDAATRASLPFSVILPAGFEIVTGRPGPDFRIYTIRRGEQSFVMVYAGPASQFPIYSGQMVETGGRASVLSTEDGVRHAMEHLFQRPDAPREVHAWTMSLEGGDRALAEQIAQSIDIR